MWTTRCLLQLFATLKLFEYDHIFMICFPISKIILDFVLGSQKAKL